MFRQMIRQVYNAETYSLTGKIENIVGMSIEASGGHAAVGDICRIYDGESGRQVTAEVVGFKNEQDPADALFRNERYFCGQLCAQYRSG